ncbi:hypothetical protein D3C86_1325330 [compost metagenome]
MLPQPGHLPGKIWRCHWRGKLKTRTARSLIVRKPVRSASPATATNARLNQSKRWHTLMRWLLQSLWGSRSLSATTANGAPDVTSKKLKTGCSAPKCCLSVPSTGKIAQKPQFAMQNTKSSQRCAIVASKKLRLICARLKNISLMQRNR